MLPRTSDTGAASGEFLAPEPRPEPETPPRHEPPEGVTANYDRDEDEDYDRDAREYAREYARDYLAQTSPSQDEDSPSSLEDSAADSITEPEGATVIELPLAQAQRVEAVLRELKSESEFESESESESESKQRASKAVTASIPALNSATVIAASDGRGSGSRTTMVMVGLAAAAALGLFIYNQSQGQEPELAGAGEPSKPARPSTSDSPNPSNLAASGDSAGTGDADPPRSGSTDDGSGTETDTGDSGTETGPDSDSTKTQNADPRDPSVIPSGTPEENAKAFTKLPVSIHDGPPIGGIGHSGIHIDEISTSRGRDNTDCDQPMERFSIGVAKYVNVCFRVVHPREQESLRVVWEKDGKVTRRGRVRIPELHAYTTRAFLLLRPEYVGDWRVRIMPEDEESIDLAVAEFVITE